jgi:hypothetical protein
MKKIVKAAVLSAVAATTLGGLGGTAHATCYVNSVTPPLGVCASAKQEDVGYCVHAKVYTSTSADPEVLKCVGI